MSDLARQLRNYRLTTAQILYHMPDHPSLLQSFVWQFMDKAPKYPELERFLAFWECSIEARIHSVQIMNRDVVAASEVGYCGNELRLH